MSETITLSNYSDLLAAQDSLGSAGGTIIIDKPLTLTVAFSPASNITFKGIPGVVIAQPDPQANVFNLYAAQNFVSFINLTMSGGRAAVSGFNCPNTLIQGCVITDCYFRGLDFGGGAGNLVISDNSLNNFATGTEDGIFCEDVGAGLRIINNSLTAHVKTHGIAVHTSGGAITAPVVSGNVIDYLGENFAIEVGKFNSGRRINNAVVSDNTILFRGGCGAISLSSVDTSKATGNNINMNYVVPTIQAIEFVDVQYGVMTGNTVINSGANGGAADLDSSSNILVANNNFNGYVFIVNSGTCPGVLAIRDNVIQENIISIPTGATRPYVFYIQANVAGCLADNNKFLGNIITSPIVVSLIKLENDYPGAATINGTVTVGNSIN